MFGLWPSSERLGEALLALESGRRDHHQPARRGARRTAWPRGRRHAVARHADDGQGQPDKERGTGGLRQQARPRLQAMAVDDAVEARGRERVAQVAQGDDKREQRVLLGGKNPCQDEVGACESRRPTAHRPPCCAAWATARAPSRQGPGDLRFHGVVERGQLAARRLRRELLLNVRPGAGAKALAQRSVAQERRPGRCPVPRGPDRPGRPSGRPGPGCGSGAGSPARRCPSPDRNRSSSACSAP